MCGLVGMSGKLAYKDELPMRGLLVVDYFRGQDSTGLASIKGSGEVKIAKIASHPLNLFDTGRFKDALNGTQCHTFIGHNRAMTRGAVNEINAHPFQFGHIVGAHNGTLDISAVDRLEKELGEKFTVDSMAIFAGFEKLGVKKTIELISGAWSLTWFDLKENTINFLRNKERPLWYVFTKEFDRLLWASEWEMLRHIEKTYEYFVEEKTKHKYFPTDADVWYSFNAADLRGGTKRPKPKAKTLKGRETPVAASTGHTPYNPFQRDEDGRTTPTTQPSMGFHANRGRTTGSSTTGTSRRNNLPDVIHIEGTPTSPYGGEITKERFDAIAKSCIWCHEEIVWGDQGITIYDADDCAICSRPTCNGPSRMQTRIFKRSMDNVILAFPQPAM